MDNDKPEEKVKVSTDTLTYFKPDRFAMDSIVAIVLGQITLQ